MSRTISLAALGLVALAASLSLACGPASDAPEPTPATTVPQTTSISESPQEALDSLGAESVSINSFRVTETQVNSGVERDVPWTKTSRMVVEYQAPDRQRTVILAVEYVRDTDGDGIFEAVTGGSSCETQEAVTIATTFYERCDSEPWTLTEGTRAYVVPIQIADDLLFMVRELEELRLLATEMIDGRPMLVLEGRMTEIPQEMGDATRTVWIDIEIGLVRRIVETIRFENEDIVATADYTDYGNVTIEEPVVS